MRIVAASDLHGQLPPVADIPRGDVLALVGDLCPDGDPAYQLDWLHARFADWVEQLPMSHVVATWGNHDWVGQHVPAPAVANVSWLCDSGVEIDGSRFWGSPWSLPFRDWPFMRPEAELAEIWELMWDDADVVIVHCPPFGCGDLTRDGQHIGSLSLRRRVEKVHPQLVLFGHIHEAFGQWDVAGGVWANVSLVNFHGRLVRQPQVFSILGPAEQ